MMTPASIRQAIAAALVARGWTESPLPLDLFGGEPRTVAHRAFSVWVRSTTPEAGARQRDHVAAHSVVSVAYLSRIDRDHMLRSVDAAMELELDVIAAVMGVPQQHPCDAHLEGVTSRATPTPEWYRGEIRFDVLHTYPLTGAPPVQCTEASP